MPYTLDAPTRATPAGDAARRLARWIGPGLAARDGTTSAATLLALGTTIATTRARATAAVVGAIGPWATETLPEWEASLGLPYGEGFTTSSRQTAVRTRWRAANAGPAPAEVLRTVRSMDPAAELHEVPIQRVLGTDPAACMRVVVLLSDSVRADAAACQRIDAALAIELPAHVDWSLGRGPLPLRHFRTNRTTSRVDRDVLDT